MKRFINRRKFIKSGLISGVGLAVSFPPGNVAVNHGKIGIIGLDTSHSVAFSKAINGDAYPGFRVVAAYPKGSNDIVSATSRISGYTEEVKKYDVEICHSIEDLLAKCDFVLLETNDGRLHLEQALKVFKAGKPVFIDKPIAASLKDAIKIFDAAEKYKVPVFSSSALRYMENVQAVVNGKIGKVSGADTYSPATIEKTHPDLFWYGIHGIEILFAVMGMGCKSVTRAFSEKTDVVMGTWKDGRIGTFRGTRDGIHDYGGIAFGEKSNLLLGPFVDYEPLLKQIIDFFSTGKVPVSREETLEMLAFMEAADESKKNYGTAVQLEAIMKRAHSK